MNEDMYLWGYHRISGEWKRLQGPSNHATLDSYWQYFRHDTVAESYAGVPYSGFANDTRKLYVDARISKLKPRGKP
jgi:hypothetical protein